jgi:diguanylate cyclase (GGDEF)-like protein/PAS domain S-box-containing protein
MAQNMLLIQDDADCANSVRDTLGNARDPAYHVEWVRTCAAGLERLAGGGIAAVLLDLSLPDVAGIGAFDRLFAASPQIPMLILTTSKDEDAAKIAVQHGAQDYVLKDSLHGFPLPKAIAGMVDRAANIEALFAEKERAQVTLDSIGDAVISTDVEGRVTYLNVVAERLTGWPRGEAAGRPLEEVFRIIDSATRAPVPNPMAIATRTDKTVALTPNCVLIRRDGAEAAIEDSAAPIHDRRGQVTGAVIVFHDVSAARALAQKMTHLAQHDSLTDLPNRLLLNDRLAQAMALAQRHKEKLAVLYLDVDRFKHINDSLGHAIGDRLLQSVAERLRRCVRTSDTVSRQGGDEFVVLSGEILHPQDAAICAEKILQAVSEPHTIDRHDVYVTASIGIVVYPEDGADADTLLKHADFAMYQAKDSGRNNYQFYEPDLNVSASERQALETSMRLAIQSHQFELHYQPQMNLASAAISGVEALIRWRHPVRGIMLPGHFISIAEESGMIVPIGRWVLREGCRQGKVWQDAGLVPVRLAVNISAVELRAKDFVAAVRGILAETGFDPQCLVLELTETFLMQDSKSTADVLRAIKDMGVRLALDDFGTGYSSLSYMRRFPIDILKIDKSFVLDLSTDENDASVVSAVIELGRSLHMRVIAEGVETRAQLAFLKNHGCLEGQGNYFSCPVGAAELGGLLRHGIREERPAVVR